MRQLLLLLLLLLLPFVAVGYSPSPDKIRVDERGDFVDGYGRVRIFRGINSVRKSPPWYSPQILNATKLRAYQQWGFNVVRLGAMWTGVQPTGPQPNRTYLGQLAAIVDALAEHGMYSFMDMHQDVLTSKYGGYDGAPRWLVDKFPEPPLPYPWPLKRVSQWAEGYLTWAVSSAFQHLYANTSSAWTHWGSFWRSVAESVSAKPLLLGYELINEPWAGDVFSRPARALPGVAGADNLLPVYDYLSEQLAKVDPHSVVLYEPVTWALVIGGGGAAGTGFGRLPTGAVGRAALSFHYYCWLLGAADEQKFFPEWKRLACDELLLRRTMDNAEEARRRTGGASILTEFGLCAPNGMRNSTGTVECNEVLRQADERMLSWTYWDSNFTDADGAFNWDVVRSFSRPYPTATAGRPLRFSFDLASARFEFAFSYNASVAADTEVFLPMSVHYPAGVGVVVSSGFAHNVSGNCLRLRAPPGAASGQKVAVVVTKLRP